MKRLLTVLVVLLLVGVGYYFLGLQPPAERPRPDDSPIVKPAYELKVQDVTGSPKIKIPGSDTGWVSPAPGQVLPEGSQVRTEEGGEIEMVVPERAYFTFEDGSMSVEEIDVDTATRRIEDTGPERVVERNELELETEEGTLRNSIQEDTSSTNNYKIRTPSAVMGVRGTTYGCQTDESGSTSCAVLEGEVEFSSRADTSRSVQLTSGRTSSVSKEDTEPTEPRSYSQSRKQDLRGVRSEARRQLRKRPVVHSVSLGDTPLTVRTKLTYRTQRQLRLRGRADSRGIAPIEEVSVTVNGQSFTTEGTRRWSTEITPEAPEPGSSRRVSITVQAHTETDRSSLLEHFDVILNHPLEVPPPGYEQQSMDFELLDIGAVERDAFEMPYTLYTSDLSGRTLRLAGSVQSDEGSVERLVYRVSGRDTWKQTRTGGDWVLSVKPPRSRTWTLDVMAMTDRKTHSGVETLGPFRSREITASAAINRDFETFWDNFVQKNWSDLMPLLSEEFRFTHPEDGPVDAERFREVLSTYGRNTGELSAMARVKSIEVNGREATLRAKLDLNGQLSESYEGPLGMPPLANGYEAEGNFDYRRDSDGVFRLASLDGRARAEPEPELETTIPLTTGTSRTLQLDHRSGIDLSRLEAVDNSPNPAAQRQDGHLVAGLDPEPFVWGGGPPTLYVNDGSHTFCTGYYCYDYPVRSGGIRRAPTDDLSELESFPALRDEAFKSKVEVEAGSLYFVHVATSDNEKRKAIVRVDDVPESASGSLILTVIEVK